MGRSRTNLGRRAPRIWQVYSRDPGREETEGGCSDWIRPWQVRRVLKMGTRVLGGTRRRRCNPRMPGRSGRSGRTGRKGGRLGRTERMGRTHAVRTRALSVWSKQFFLLMSFLVVLRFQSPEVERRWFVPISCTEPSSFYRHLPTILTLVTHHLVSQLIVGHSVKSIS